MALNPAIFKWSSGKLTGFLHLFPAFFEHFSKPKEVEVTIVNQKKRDFDVESNVAYLTQDLLEHAVGLSPYIEAESYVEQFKIYRRSKCPLVVSQSGQQGKALSGAAGCLVQSYLRRSRSRKSLVTMWERPLWERPL